VRTGQEQSLAKIYEQMGAKYYVLSGSQTFLDMLVKNLIETKSFHYAQIEPAGIFKRNYYVTVLGEFIFETSLPRYISELMDEVYVKITNISEFNAQDILNLINMPGKTELTITHDRKKALKIKQEVLGKFI
jgi:hypothetical protein